jgi:hypothetical protein
MVLSLQGLDPETEFHLELQPWQYFVRQVAVWRFQSTVSMFAEQQDV